MRKEGLKHIPAKLEKTVIGGAIIFPSQARADLLPTLFDPSELSAGLRVGISLGLLGFLAVSTSKALEFSHHAEKHEKYLAWAGVAFQAAASLAIIADTWI